MQFNGIRKDYLSVLRGRKRPAWAPITRNILTISGRPGGFHQLMDTDVRRIEVPVLIEGDNITDIQKLKEDLAVWLITDEEAELIFDDEPDRVYFAMVDGTLDLAELVTIGTGIITFICPDPYKSGTEKNVSFQDAGTIIVEGSAESFPVITCQINNDTTFVAVSDGDKINLIGNPVRQEETPYNPETAALIHGCNTLTGWTNSSATSIDVGEQLGTLKTDGEVFHSDDYGTLVSVWHGPAMKTSIGQVLQDFRLDVGFSMLKTGANQAGGIEVALLDANSAIVTKVSMTKHFGSLNNLYSRVRAGTLANGHDVVNENQAIFQSSISGVFRVSRKGNWWTAQVFYKVGTVFVSKILETWTDDDNIAAAPVTQVQARLIQRGDFPIVKQQIGDIKIYKLNDATSGQVPIIARAGDIIEFDHQNDVIRKNGEDFTKEKAFIGEYFSLKPGVSAFVAEPMDAIGDVEVRWRPRWR